MKEYLKKYARDLVETKDRLQKENNKLTLENKKLKEQLILSGVVGQSEQLNLSEEQKKEAYGNAWHDSEPFEDTPEV